MFMHRFWKTFRFGVLVIAFIALGIYLIQFTDWDKVLGRRPMYPEFTREGQVVVDAVYRFKNDRGLWPEVLEDLAPQYLTREQVLAIENNNWLYEIQLDGRPGLSKKLENKIRTHVGFDFDPEKPSWIVFGGQERRLNRVAPPPPSTLPAETLLARQLEELDRRIELSAGSIVMEYQRDKVSLLRAAGKFAEARRLLEAAAEQNVHHFWPRLAKVKLDLEQPALALPAATTSAPATLPTTAPATAPATSTAPATMPTLPPSFVEFDQWVHANPSFTHWYYLSLAYRWVGHDAQALAAIEEASKLPPVPGLADNHTAAYYLWDMARYTLRQKKYPQVLALTEAWSNIQAHRGFTEYSYLPLSAAAKLATGDFAGAKAAMEKLKEEKPPATWADHLPALQTAVDRGDAAFQYDPGDKKPPYEVFSRPQ